MNDETENGGSLSREEKIQQLRSSGAPRINTPKVEDPTRLYTIIFLALISAWGMMDPQSWFFSNLGLLVLFMVVRRQSRFQVPWMLEIYPILSIVYFILAAYWKRNEIFSPYDQNNAALLGTLWTATFAYFGFAFTCLLVVHRMAPENEPFMTRVPERPVPKRVLVQLYIVGVFLNSFVRFLVPMEIRVVIITFGQMEIVALLIFIYQCLAESPGFKPSQIKWPLAGVAFWFLRESANTLFGGPVATLLVAAPLFARYVKPWVVTLGIAFGLIFVPLIQGVKKEIRAGTEKGTAGHVDPKTIPRVFIRNVNEVIVDGVFEGDMKPYKNGFDEFVDRVFLTGILLTIKENMDLRQNFAYGKTLEHSIFWNFIPRVIYPDKPVTGGSSDLAREYGGMMIEPGTSVGVGPISEFYVNFGTTGAILCMVLMGGGYGWIIGFLFKQRIQPLGYIYAALAFVAVIRPEMNLADSFGGAIRAVFMWFLLRWYISRQIRNQVAPTADPEPPSDPQPSE